MVGVVVFFEPQHLPLKTASDVASLALKPLKLGVVLSPRVGFGCRQLGVQQPQAARAEDPFGKEVEDGVEDLVLLDAEDARMAGLYAWWLTARDALGEVPAPHHPTLSGLRLLYVGIAPRDSRSRETLRSRVVRKHLGPTLAGSTFRRSLAALLWDESGWTPRLTPAGRFKLSTVDDEALRRWQDRALRVSWAPVEDPWIVEAAAIASLNPPLNLRDNRHHPFHDSMSAARARFKARAEALGRE